MRMCDALQNRDDVITSLNCVKLVRKFELIIMSNLTDKKLQRKLRCGRRE